MILDLHQLPSIVSVHITGDGVEVSVHFTIVVLVVDGGGLTAQVADDVGLHHHGVGVVTNDVGAGGAPL